jgi:hypothetical protein
VFNLGGMLTTLSRHLYVGGELGSNYYYGENLVWLLALQLQAKFKLEAIFENEKVFGKRKLCLIGKTFFLGKNWRLMVIKFVGLGSVFVGCGWEKKLVFNGRTWVHFPLEIALFWILFMLVLFWEVKFYSCMLYSCKQLKVKFWYAWPLCTFILFWNLKVDLFITNKGIFKNMNECLTNWCNKLSF